MIWHLDAIVENSQEVSHQDSALFSPSVQGEGTGPLSSSSLALPQPPLALAVETAAAISICIGNLLSIWPLVQYFFP